jgi:N-acetylglutamate synthase-like GNAT family acetyltransferase
MQRAIPDPDMPRRIRPLRADTGDDLKQVLALQEEWITRGLLPETFNRLTSDRITAQNTIVVELNGNIVGYCCFFKGQDCYQIDSVYVSDRPEYKGLGKELVKAAEEKIRSLGGNRIVLWPTTTGNKKKLVDHYESMGYRQTNEHMEKEI